jgi:GxxExxY protein
MTENEISTILVSIFFKVHSKLGPGLLESVYESAICHEISVLGLKYQRQQGIKVIYDGIKMDNGFRADIIVDEKVIVEIKSVEAMSPVFFKTLLTYLRLSDIKLGLLVNFNVSFMKNGITRIVNNL